MIRHIAGMAMEIHPDAFIAEGAAIVGEVRVGESASIWYGAVLRGDCGAIAIGAGSHVEDNVVVHGKTELGRSVVVGHAAVLHGCAVEDGCLIGMGAIVMEGAVVGAGSFVGAGSLVTEGMRIPPNSLAMGRPARVVGRPSEEQRAYMRCGAEEYVRLAGLQLPRFRDSAPNPERPDSE